MKAIPALRHSYANGILRALAARGPSTIGDLIASSSSADLFKGNTTHPDQRARDLLQYSGELGLVRVEDGTYALTEAGSAYVAAGGGSDPWAVQPSQAQILRQLLREHQHDGGVYEGAALALSLLASADGNSVKSADLGEALAQLGEMDGWKELRTFVSQGDRYKQLLRELGFVDAQWHVNDEGREALATMVVSQHPSLSELLADRRKLQPLLEQKVWLVRAGDRGQAESINLEQSVISIGWTELPDLAEIESIEEMRELYAETFPDATPANLNTQARQVFLFVREMAEGDLVLTPLRTRPGFVAVGRVIGPYEYRNQPPFVADAEHTHAVEWLSAASPLEAFPQVLRSKFGLPQTVNQLDVPGAVRLVEDALNGTTDAAVHLVVKWTPRWGADTDVKHIAVAREYGAVWWGLLSRTDEPRVSAQRQRQLREQLEGGHDVYAFIVGQVGGAKCWRTRLLDFSLDRSSVDPELVPSYYSSDWKFHLWLKLTDFEELERDELYRLLDPDTGPGQPLALSNQTNPLFVRMRTTPRYWWVNQGASFQRAREGRFLWAPLLDKAGREKDHWRTMRHLRPGDVVLNYANTQIRATSVVLADAQPATRPDPEADQAWSNDGLRVELDWRDLADPVKLSEIPAEWRKGERVFAGDGSVNQGYLFPLSDAFVSKLAERYPQLLDGDAPRPITWNDGWVEPSFDEIAESIASSGMTLETKLVRRYHLSLKTRGFVVLSGVSGTGKTWLAQAYADAVQARAIVVPVAPNWTTNEDLLGYLNPLKSQYQDTAFSLFLREAASEFKDATAQERDAVPYHLILDEMNLARVEYYFAKFLSAMELRARSTDAAIELAPGDLVLLPPNLKFIGTVNVDETTHGFADKVYDRSQLIEMTIDRTAVEAHLDGRPFATLVGDLWTALAAVAPFAFRVLDEIISYVDEAVTLEVGWEEALDEQLLQKVLPKIKGTDLRLGVALRTFADLTADTFPLSHAKATSMLAAFNEHGFTSYF